MINRVGTIWGTNADGRPEPIAVHRVGGQFRLTGNRGAHFLDDSVEAAICAASAHFGLSDPSFGPSRLPVRNEESGRRGSHPSYGWNQAS